MKLTFFEISSNPRILYIAGWYTHSSKQEELNYFLERIDGNCILLYHYPAQVFEESLGRVNSLNEKFTAKFPKIRIILLVNSEYDLIHFRENNIECYFIHQNIFCSTEKFFIKKSIKKYDAIYNAQFIKIKRHYLCSKINNLALIGYNYESDESKEIIQSLHGHHLLNFRPDGSYIWMNEANINNIYNESRVGLCLSPHEGAMYAATEYLLSGIPVVTTPNYGGRNFFFDPYLVEFVDPDPDFLLYGVKRLITQNLNPFKIREITIKKINEHLDLFIQLVNSLGFQYNKNFKYIDDEMRNFEVHKLVSRLDIDEYLNFKDKNI
jgi:hypothetical protein